MLTGPIRNDIDKLWEKFWTGGITNPLTVIEQISYLMFARMLDMQEDIAERKAARTKKDFERLFPNTPDGQLRQELIENNQLEGIVSLPSGVFKPYAGVSTAILMFTKGSSNDLPDAIAKWKQYRELVDAKDIVANKFDLSINRYKEVKYSDLVGKCAKAEINFEGSFGAFCARHCKSSL